MYNLKVGEKNVGAKGKYEKWLQPENLTLIQGWRRDGLSDKQVAANIGINQATLYDWLKRFDKFAEAYKKGTETSLYEVENALYKSACGYDVTEAETVTTTLPNGEETKTVRKRLRHISPNVGAICFILKNKKKDAWKDKPADDDAANGEPVIVEIPGDDEA